jgi:hypothetical protein
MSVEVQFLGRLGNNLFQYALGRILAEEMGMQLKCLAPSHLGSYATETAVQPSSTLPALKDFFPNISFEIPGDEITYPEERYVLGERFWSGHGVPVQNIIARRSKSKIVLKGFFQRYEYLLPYKDRIKEWYKIKPRAKSFAFDNDDVVVSIRRGADYAVHGWRLHLSYYKNALRSMNPKTVYVVGTGVDNEVLDALSNFNPIHLSGEPIEEFCIIMAANKIILSNSTFAWWAAWLSKATDIVYPRPERYWGIECPDVNLEVPEERYRYIDVIGSDRWQPFERNPDVSLSVNKTRDQIVVRVHSSGRTKKLTAHHLYLSLINAICDTNGKFGPDEIRPHMKGLSLRPAFRDIFYPLVSLGAINADDECKTFLTHINSESHGRAPLKPSLRRWVLQQLGK